MKRESMEKEKESLNKSDAVALKRREAELITELNGQQKNLVRKAEIPGAETDSISGCTESD